MKPISVSPYAVVVMMCFSMPFFSSARTTCGNPGAIQGGREVLVKQKTFEAFHGESVSPGDPSRIHQVIDVAPYTGAMATESVFRNMKTTHRLFKTSDAYASVDECNGWIVGGMYNGKDIQSIFADGTMLVDGVLVKPASTAKPNSFRRGEIALFFPTQYRQAARLVRIRKMDGHFTIVETDRHSRFLDLDPSDIEKYIYLEAGMKADVVSDTSQALLLKVPTSRLLAQTKCVRDICVGQTLTHRNQDESWTGPTYIVVKTVFPNGDFYGEVRSLKYGSVLSESRYFLGPGENPFSHYKVPKRQKYSLPPTSRVAVSGIVPAKADADGILRDANGKILRMSLYEAAGVNPRTGNKENPDICEKYGRGHLATIRELAEDADSRGAFSIVELAEVRESGQVPEGYSRIAAINTGGVTDTFYFHPGRMQDRDGDVYNNSFWSASMVNSRDEMKDEAYIFSRGEYEYATNLDRVDLRAVRCMPGR